MSGAAPARAAARSSSGMPGCTSLHPREQKGSLLLLLVLLETLAQETQKHGHIQIVLTADASKVFQYF